ncbi:MAG: AMP-binding protein [Dehalococcoidia bacterium]
MTAPFPNHPDYDVPPGATLPTLLRERCARQPDDPAVYIDGGWLNGAELGRLVFRGAHALIAAGVRRGDRIGTLLPNNRAFLATWLGGAEIGATLVPVNINLTGDTLRYIVEHADLHALVLDESVLSAYRGAFGERHPARRVLCNGADLPGTDRFEAFLADAAAMEAPLSLLDEASADPALIIYTSGTTGRPKGVVLSRAAQLAHGWFYGKDFVRLGPGETAYTCLPLFHVTSMGFSLGCLLGGAAVAIDARFNPFGFWDEVRRHHAKMFPYVGAMIGMLSARPPRPDDVAVPAVRAIGSATPPELWEPFERRFGLTLIETWGQSELASLWFMPPPEGRRVGTVGKPAPRMDAYIAAATAGSDGELAPPGDVGELVVRAHAPLQMTSGYFRDEQTTRRAFRGDWYWTGDAAEMDADGYYRFRGRLKDFIRRRGENVSAFEVEREALTHPAVKEAAAVGVPSAMGEEEIKLCIVLGDGESLDPAVLFRHLRERLSGFMLPRYIQLYADFPRTTTQRVQKFRLAEDGVPPIAWDRHAGGWPVDGPPAPNNGEA